MYAATLAPDADAATFRAVARRALAAGLSPQQIAFVPSDGATLLPPLPEGAGGAPPSTVPRPYADLLEQTICHRAEDRFALLYDLLWRIAHGERDIVSRATDPVVARLNAYAHAVRRDIHKMHAFLRFRECRQDGHVVFTAWFEPQHFILRRAVPFFVERFAAMDWLIATPVGTAIWRDRELAYAQPIAKPDAPDDAVLDELWLTYYRTTFNPARVRLKAMAAEMPKHYWANMPETAQIPAMVAAAGGRVATMREQTPDAPQPFARRLAERPRQPTLVPAAPLARLRAEAAGCQRCPLHGPATQTVFGAGPEDAALVFVGEQPGDQEDLSGKPFVGPAGELFDQALGEAGIDRTAVYVTNAVKHFKYEPRGKRRIHQKPNAGEVQHCRWWLEAELAAIAPKLVVALGGTAAQTLGGRPVSVLRERGPAQLQGRRGFITVHPSFLLRLPDEQRRADEYARFIADLRRVRDLLEVVAA